MARNAHDSVGSPQQKDFAVSMELTPEMKTELLERIARGFEHFCSSCGSEVMSSQYVTSLDQP
jgi:hypothetical protein